MAMTAQEKYDFYHGGPKKAKFNSAADGNAGKALKSPKAIKQIQGPNTPPEILRFPLNIQDYPTYMEYTAHAFVPGFKDGKEVFGGGAANEVILATIYLPAIKSDMTEKQNWEWQNINDSMKNISGAFQSSEGFMETGKNVLSAGGSSMISSKKIAALNIMGNRMGTNVIEGQALQYKEPDTRNFSVSYTFVPRDEQESVAIRDIIKTFREHAAPIDGETGAHIRTYKFPSLFKIKWLDGNAEDNKWLPQYTTCYCDTVTVGYGDDQFTTFNGTGGAPTTYTLSLSFSELEYPTRQRVKDGN